MSDKSLYDEDGIDGPWIKAMAENVAKTIEAECGCCREVTVMRIITPVSHEDGCFMECTVCELSRRPMASDFGA